MNARELNELFGQTLRSGHPSVEQFEQLAEALLEAHRSGDPRFGRHVQNRLKQIAERTGEEESTKRPFDLEAARLLMADEVGFADWNSLQEKLSGEEAGKPILFQYAVAAMVRGDFTALEEAVGPEHFDASVIQWYENGYFDERRETLAEIFSAACMLGHPRAAGYLLDKGVDPLAGTRTGLNGFHYAASSGRLEVINLLIERKVPIEARNMYGGTVFEQAMWSAVNEHTPSHAAIIEALIEAGAVVEPGTVEWWEEQDVPSAETKRRVARALSDQAP